MINDSKVTENSFTLVTSRRKNKKNHTNKQKFDNPILNSNDEIIDEESVLK